MASNPSQFVEEVYATSQLETVYDDAGAPTGLQVNQLSKNTFLSQLGIQNGDIIKEIAGLELQAVEDLKTVTRLMASSRSSVLVTVERGDILYGYRHSIVSKLEQ